MCGADGMPAQAKNSFWAPHSHRGSCYTKPNTAGLRASREERCQGVPPARREAAASAHSTSCSTSRRLAAGQSLPL